MCSDAVSRPMLASERVVSKGPSPATSYAALAGGCAPYPATCKSGFVWRAAFSVGIACVTSETRARAAADNAEAASRRVPNGGPTCKSGYVWRAANPSDLVCVSPQTRSQTAADNRQANELRLVPRYRRLFQRRR